MNTRADNRAGLIIAFAIILVIVLSVWPGVSRLLKMNDENARARKAADAYCASHGGTLAAQANEKDQTVVVTCSDGEGATLPLPSP